MKKVTGGPNSVSTETKVASCQHLYAGREAKSDSKAIWIENPFQPHARLNVLWFQLRHIASTARLVQLFTELSLTTPTKLKAKHS